MVERAVLDLNEVDMYTLTLGSWGDLASVTELLRQMREEYFGMTIHPIATSSSERTDKATSEQGFSEWVLKRFVENRDFAAANQRNIIMQGIFFMSILWEMPQLIHGVIDYLLAHDYFDTKKTGRKKEVLITLAGWAFFAPLLYALGIQPTVVGVADGIDERSDFPPFLLHNPKLAEKEGMPRDHQNAKKQFDQIFVRQIVFFVRLALEKRGLYGEEQKHRLEEVKEKGLDPKYMAKGAVYASRAEENGGVKVLDDGTENGSPLAVVNRTAVDEVTKNDEQLQKKLDDSKVKRVVAFMSGSMVIKMGKLRRMMAYAQKKLRETPGMEDVLLVYVNAHGDKKKLPIGEQLYMTQAGIPLDQLFGHPKCVGAFIHGGAGTSAKCGEHGIPSVSYVHTGEQRIQTELNHKSLEMQDLDGSTKHIGDVTPELFWQDLQSLLIRKPVNSENKRAIPLGNKSYYEAVTKIMKGQPLAA